MENQDCITVDSNSVLYLQGNTIKSTAPVSDQQNSNGIHLTEKADGAIVVGGGATISGFTNGILIEDDDVNVGNFSATKNNTGVFVNFAKRATLFNFDSSNNGVGIQLIHSKDTFLGNFTANSNGSDGAFLSGASNTRFMSFQADLNANSGLYIEGGGCNYLTRNCLEVKSLKNRIYGGTITNNVFTGISIVFFQNWKGSSDRDEIIDNNVHQNGVVDLDEQNPDCAHNLWKGNTFGAASQTCVH